MCTIFRRWTIVCYERLRKKNMNLLKKKIISDNCLLREKYNILNLSSVCKKIKIYWWIKMKV